MKRCFPWKHVFGFEELAPETSRILKIYGEGALNGTKVWQKICKKCGKIVYRIEDIRGVIRATAQSAGG